MKNFSTMIDKPARIKENILDESLRALSNFDPDKIATEIKIHKSVERHLLYPIVEIDTKKSLIAGGKFLGIKVSIDPSLNEGEWEIRNAKNEILNKGKINEKPL